MNKQICTIVENDPRVLLPHSEANKKSNLENSDFVILLSSVFFLTFDKTHREHENVLNVKQMHNYRRGTFPGLIAIQNTHM